MGAPRLALMLLAGVLLGVSAMAQPLGVAVKAAFLPKFVPYVDWPAGAAPAAGAPSVLCIVGRDPFGALVDEAGAGERRGASAITVRRMERIERGAACHVAYLGGSKSQTVGAALAATNGTPVLTVTDARAARERGVIHFELQGGRVRFHIDDALAARSGLGLSSKLLGLALSVKQRGRP